jgi:hypothetical protein
MKKILFIILFLSAAIVGLYAQQQYTYYITYDASGNRVSRMSLGLKSDLGESFLDSSNQEINEKLLPKEIDDYLSGTNIKLYPNPTRGELAIEFVNYPDDAEVQIKLYDFSGKELKVNKISSQYSLVDINDFPDGNYLLTIQIGDDSKTYNIIKQ